MKKDLLKNPVELRTAASAPRFADRRVVQRAQRVVPLDEIRGRVRLRRFWLLGGAFAVALMLGAASALVAVQIKRLTANNHIPQVPQVEEPEVTATAADVQPLPVQEDPVPESETAAEEVPTKPAKTIVAAAKRPEPEPAQRPRVVGKDRETLSGGGVQPSEEEQLQQIREQVLYDRWQERRMRRIERRERRNRSDRDLSHLDEIFEGRRRPERP